MVRKNRRILFIAWLLAIVCIFSGCGLLASPQSSQTPLASTQTSLGNPTETPADSGETVGILASSTPVLVPTPTPDQIQTPESTEVPVVTPTIVPLPTSTKTPAVTQASTATKTPSVSIAPTKTPSATPTFTPTKTPSATPTPTSAKTPAPTQGTVTVTQAPVYCRTVLNASQQAAYDTIVAGVSDVNAIQTLSGDMGNGIKVSLQYRAQSNLAAEIALIVETIIMDHPELFYILNQYTYSYSGMKINSVTLQTLPKSQTIALKTSVEEGIQSYMQQVSSNQDQYEISKQLYELLATNILYSKETGTRAHSIVGAFVDGQGVCETYAKAYQLLLNRYGIRAFTVSGNGNGEAHRWVAMEINGNWYYSDPTWGDLKTKGDLNTYPKEGYLKVNYTYLHLTAAQMGKDHTLDSTSVQMTQGLSFTATEDNYFVKENGYFATMDYAQAEAYIKAQCIEANLNHVQTFGIQLGDLTTYYAMKEYLHNNLYRIYHSAVPGGTASLSYYLNEKQCVLHVYLG